MIFNRHAYVTIATVHTAKVQRMKRFAALQFSLYAISALAQASTQNDAGAGPESVPTSARSVSANEIPCQYALPANASYGTVPLGLAAVDVILDEKGKVQSTRILNRPGNRGGWLV
ncbi:hypothetical protein OKW29_001746 [Paraburkholderia sp. CI3]